MKQDEYKNYVELSKWWKEILTAQVQKRMKRPVNECDPNDLFLLSLEAKRLRRVMDWEVYDKNDAIDLLEKTLDKIMDLKLS